MRLLRLKLNDSYDALPEGFELHFRLPGEVSQHIEPICFIGINGSGKSNIIEIISRIFCYCELTHLQYAPKNEELPFRFEVEYELLLNKKLRRFLIRKEKKVPEFCEILESGELTIVEGLDQLNILPKRVIGYSSGRNERISFPFYRTREFYGRAVFEQAKRKVINQKKTIASRTMFLDYEINTLILLANFIFLPLTRLALFKDILRISKLQCFRISIQFNGGSVSTPVMRTKELDDIVEDLKKCAFLWEYDSDAESWIFDFHLNSASRKAFKHYFTSGSNFLTEMYKLDRLNVLALDAKDRGYHGSNSLYQGILESPPTVSPKDKVFRVSGVKVYLSGKTEPINYSAISDGEHQFMMIIGTIMLFNEPNTLFLLDEPETHFNPQWRTQFVSILNSKALANTQQELLMSTHSPFVVSDCYKGNVFKFTRNRKTHRSICEKVGFQTFGSSFDYLLTKLFDLNTLISERALNQMKAVLTKGDVEEIETALDQFGESFEKRFLYQKLAEKKAEKKEASK